MGDSGKAGSLLDTGERMIPPRAGEISLVFSRHAFAYQHALQYVEGKDVLDVGCGTGYGCGILAERARHVVGIDYDEDAIAYCRTHFQADNIKFERADATDMSRGHSFDVVVSFQVIEHMHDPVAFIDGICAQIKPGGTVLITTPNVREVKDEGVRNPFHFSEMNFDVFSRLMAERFDHVQILGIGYASDNRLRSFAQSLPFYRFLGARLKRQSALKKIAARGLEMTRFQVIGENVEDKALDLLAVARNVAHRSG